MAGIIAIAGAVMLAAGCGPASPRAKTRPRVVEPMEVSYDPLYAREMTATETKKFYALRFASAADGRGAKATSYFDHVGRGEPVAYAVGGHPLLGLLGDDAKIYVVCRPYHPWAPHLAVTLRDRVYEMPSGLNALLRDAGWRFEADEVPDWARLYVLFRLGDSCATMRKRWLWAEGKRPVVPSVVFDSVRVEPWGWVNSKRVVVSLKLDGRPQEVVMFMAIVETSRGDTLYVPSSGGIDWIELGLLDDVTSGMCIVPNEHLYLGKAEG